MLNYNILITGVGGCGVGEGLYKALQNEKQYNLFTCNNSDNSLFIFNEPKRSFIVCSADHPDYCQSILRICTVNDIKIIIPGSEQELIQLVNNRALFNDQNIYIFANTPDVINVFDSKWETFLKLKSLNVKTPDTTLSVNDKEFFEKNEFPLIIKPVIGNASKNVFLINNTEELLCIKKYLDLKKISFVIQQFINDAKEEYTISVLSDFNGKYLGSIVLKRVLAGGFSQFVECNEYPEIDRIAREIAEKVESKGPLNIQCRLMNGELYVFEINPRFSGTTPFRALLGFNEPHILFNKTFLDKEIFDRNSIYYNSFGVRGFQEKIYDNNLKKEVKIL